MVVAIFENDLTDRWQPDPIARQQQVVPPLAGDGTTVVLTEDACGTTSLRWRGVLAVAVGGRWLRSTG